MAASVKLGGNLKCRFQNPANIRHRLSQRILRETILDYINRALNLVLILLICGPAIAFADTPASDESPRLNLSIGHFGISDGLDHPFRFGVEYSARPRTPWKLIPNIGFAWSINDSNYTYVGLQRDFALTDSLILTPSFGLGFFEGSEELQLGHHLEFQSGLTIAYRFDRGYRLGVALYHLSNGGIAERNPGTESAVLAVSIPL